MSYKKTTWTSGDIITAAKMNNLEEGVAGLDGTGIASLEQVTSSTASGGANVWRATLTSGETADLTVYNGAKGETGATGAAGATGAQGETGNGIASVTQTASSTASGGANTWRITMTDGTYYDFTIYNGAQGASGSGSSSGSGSDGVGIASVEQTTTSTASGGKNVVTITLTDGSTYTFSVYNGAKGDTGATGATGATGETGAQGEAGEDGKSAYEYAVEGGVFRHRGRVCIGLRQPEI